MFRCRAKTCGNANLINLAFRISYASLQVDSSSSSSHHLCQSTFRYGAGFSSDFSSLFHQPFCAFWTEHSMFLKPALVLQPYTPHHNVKLLFRTIQTFQKFDIKKKVRKYIVGYKQHIMLYKPKHQNDKFKVRTIQPYPTLLVSTKTYIKENHHVLFGVK